MVAVSAHAPLTGIPSAHGCTPTHSRNGPDRTIAAYAGRVRYRSWSAAGVTVFAVAGTGTVSFAIKVANSARPGLLGFAVQRRTPTGTYRYVTGLKVFRSLVPDPEPGRAYSTNQHPIQSLVWDDFTVTPGTSYDYRFIPLRGRPASPRRGRPAELRVTTEPTASPTHEIHANRGVASSQAYQRRFGGLSPDAQPTAAKRQLALDWLSRDLDDALIAVIRSTGPGDTLRGAFYEFGHLPVLREFADAVARGVNLRLVLDLKVNEHWENQRQRDGSIKKVFVRSAPRLANLEAVTAAGIPMTAIVPREARRNAIQHNKFLVVHRAGVPAEVWTGSTNLTLGGIHGQANVGHLIKDPSLAATFQAYWDLLAADPGGRITDSASEVRTRNAALRAAVAAMSPVPAGRGEIARGQTAIFSPRSGTAPLDLYADLLTGAKRLACATFAFGIARQLREVLAQGDTSSPLRFFLLEKPDTKSAQVKLDSSRNIYQAWGSELSDPLGQWVVETTTRQLGLNRHVAFVHTKFLLADPLGADPIVVTGSANFSSASCQDNDENMVVIRGDLRVADIYFTEFNRLFFHYYFRSVVERLDQPDDAGARAAGPASLDLVEDDSWLLKYGPGSLRSKRAEALVTMAGAVRTGARPT